MQHMTNVFQVFHILKFIPLAYPSGIYSTI